MVFVFRCLIVGMLVCAAFPAMAQSRGAVKPDPAQLLLAPPMLEPRNPDGTRCFTVVNAAPYSVTGSLVTAPYEVVDGTGARQRLNFRLGPQENKRYCTFGPFYPGERLELVVRSLVPLFSCYTAAQGEIIIRGEMKREGGTRTWADCY